MKTDNIFGSLHRLQKASVYIILCALESLAIAIHFCTVVAPKLYFVFAGFLHGEAVARRCISSKKRDHARKYTLQGYRLWSGCTLESSKYHILVQKFIIVSYLKLCIIYQIRSQQLPKQQCAPYFSHFVCNCGTLSLIIL